MLCQKLCHNNVSGWGSIEESAVFFWKPPILNQLWGVLI